MMELKKVIDFLKTQFETIRKNMCMEMEILGQEQKRLERYWILAIYVRQ